MEGEQPSSIEKVDGHNTHGRFRAFMVNALLMLVALGGTLAAAEAYLRYTNFMAADYSHNMVMSAVWTDADQLLAFVRKPNLTWTRPSYTDEFAPVVTYSTDANGFRNPPDIDTADIAFIGDSFTEAGTIPYEKTFARLVESELGKRVVNLGRGGYGPPQELAVLWKYALPYKPKTIVWTLFEGNDIRDSDAYYNGGFKEVTLPARTNWSRMGTILFDDIELHELAPPPNGDDWYYRAAPFLNLPERFAQRHIVGDNLIRNGDFSKDLRENQWQIVPALRGSVQQVPTKRERKNGRALQVQVPAWMNVGIAQVPKNLKPSTPYLLTGKIRTENVLGPARLEVQQWEGKKTSLLRFTPGVPTTRDWTDLSLVFTTPEKVGDVRIVLRRPARPPQPPKGIKRLKLAQLVDVAVNQRARLRARWGLIGTFDSAEHGPTEVGFDYKYAPDIDTSSPHGWKVTEEMLHRGHDLCAENGIQLLVVYLPIALRVHGPHTRFDEDAPLTDYVPGGDWNTPDEFAARVAALCAERSIPFIDATVPLRDAAGQREFVYAPRYDSHLYFRGHEVVAELIANALAKQQEL
ncbi:MAG TPA: SGNH/GDSL hydrolase family protein [Candidatus Hydrogenedentes bacterium]|nr:SGNH/GDSL hydrolase family protein [Candidatus Hydrogenedentota bacterium]